MAVFYRRFSSLRGLTKFQSPLKKPGKRNFLPKVILSLCGIHGFVVMLLFVLNIFFPHSLIHDGIAVCHDVFGCFRDAYLIDLNNQWVIRLASPYKIPQCYEDLIKLHAVCLFYIWYMCFSVWGSVCVCMCVCLLALVYVIICIII